MKTPSNRRARTRKALETTALLALNQVALDSAAEGVCIYDRDNRVVLHNRRYLEIFKMSPEVVRRGTSYRRVLEHSAEMGNFSPELVEEKWRDRLTRLAAGKPFSMQQRLPSGAIMTFSFRPLPDGAWLALYDDITRQAKLESELQVQTERIEYAVAHMSHGLCMFGADERLILCNEQYLRLYDLDAAIVKPGIAHRDLIEHLLARGNAPGVSADEFYTHRMQQVRRDISSVGILTRCDGRIIQAVSRRMPDGGWISAHEDATERLRYEAALKHQNLLLDAALENMAHGLCVFDKEMRLVCANGRYRDIYGFHSDEAQPGTPLAELIGIAMDREIYPRTVPVEEMVAAIQRRLEDANESPINRRLSDGRLIAIRYRALPGGGYVGTYEDITERERSLEELSEQYLRFDAALNNMSQGLCMLDSAMRIIVCNRRYIDMYGLSPEIVKPGVTMREVMEHSVALGNHPGTTARELYDGYVAKLEKGARTLHRHLGDGRIIKLNHHPMQNGGWVITYEDVTERQAAEARVAHMARHDALTDLPNRVLFRETMTEGLAQVETAGQAMAVMCLDLDNFKGVNDRLGHPVGDRLLRWVASRLQECVGGDGMVARLGGDEFAVLRTGPQPQAAEELARRVIEIVGRPLRLDNQVIHTGVSMGIVIAPNDGLDPDHLMKCADLALYRAKAEGRGVHRFFRPEMEQQVRARHALEIDLRDALEAGEFHLAYQPQIRLATGALTAFEALLRWNSAKRGAVPPGDFIGVAEETGLIVPLGEWVLRTACATAAKWPDFVKVAVNLSPVQFKARGLVSMVTSALATAGLPPSRLELEITEAVLLEDDEATLTTLHRLRALGVRVCMDDFGIGYSSLSYLRKFPFDKIKIDRSFVGKLDRASDDGAIVRAIAGLGTSLGVATTAEGIESAEQLELVRHAGCTEAQGYYFSPPRPASEVFGIIARLQGTAAVA